MMLALWGQLLDHDLTATAQPRSLNGSTPRCCGSNDDALHPSCLPIKVPLDDPWLSPLGVRCLEFLRSAPAQRRDCLLSWREQTNQVTSYIDASPIYSSNPRTSDNARIFRSGMLLFGRGPPSEDVCFRAALANQCIRPGDARSGEQPGLLMLHMVWVNEHNQIATQLSDINPHWSDEKLYQETRRIIGAMFQHITYREFLPIILGKEVSRLFNLELENSGYYKGYDPSVNPTVANEFSAAAFRFGHSLIQGSYMRADRHHRFIGNNVTLHEESADGDLGGPGSLHRLVRGMVNQRALKRDEFITAELTNHLFQTRSFPFGLDLAAINIQRGRDHGIQPYVNWRIPCGLTPIKDWEDLDRVMGPASAHRLRKAYRSVDDIDLFVGGLAERPVVGGIVGPTFSCIIAQQFGNLRKGDRFWYENPGFESSFTPAQLESIRQVAFSQVLCRALGGGTLQPHAFLPADIGQNDRLSCDSKLMAPIDLEPWTERDPFTRPNDLPNTGQSDNLVEVDTLQGLFTATSTTRRPTKKANNVVNKVDFIPNGNTGLQIPSNGQIVLTSSSRPQTTAAVNNKLDLNQSTQRPLSLSHATSSRPLPQKEPIQTTANAIDNKLDLTATTVPPPKRKPTRKTTPKRRPTPSTNLIQSNVDFSLKRDSNSTVTEDPIRHRRDLTYVNLSKLFTKEDNATLPRKRITLRRGYYPAPEPPSDYDEVNNYDYNNGDGDPPVFVKPGYGYNSGYEPPTEPPPPPNPYYYPATEEPPPPPPQPPYCGYNCYNPPMTTYNPYGLDTRKPARVTTPKRGHTNKIVNTDYNEYKRRTTRPPTHQQLQQQRTTTSRTVILRPGLVVINENRPNDKPIFLSPSSSSSSSGSPSSSSSFNSNAFHQSSKNPSFSAASQSVFSVETRPEFSSRPITHQQHHQQSVPSPIFSQKKQSHNKPLKELRTENADRLPSKLISTFDRDYDYESLLPDHERLDTMTNIHEHDGYLRPEQNKYEPLKKTSDLETYRNYSAYNERGRSTVATYEIPTGRTLWTDKYPGRYAATYQQTQLANEDDTLDQFVGGLIDQDKVQTPFSSTKRYSDENEVVPNVTVTDKVDMTGDEQLLNGTDEGSLNDVDNTEQDTNSDGDNGRLDTNVQDRTETQGDDIETTSQINKRTELPDKRNLTNDLVDVSTDKLTANDTTSDSQISTGATSDEQTTETLTTSLLLDTDLPNDALLQHLTDTLARTSNHKDILALDETDTSDNADARKLPRLDQSDKTSTPLPTPTSTDRRTTHGPRRRRPTKAKRPGIALVPFVLLTSIERPDNWVMVNVAKSKKRNPLPEVPQLKSEVFSLSELPKPISEEE